MKLLKTKPSEKVRILVVEDHPLFRMGVIDLLNRQADLTVCGEANSVMTAKTAVAKLKPRLVLLDLRLGNDDSLELIKILKAQSSELLIVVLSQYDEAIYAERALRAGAGAYVLKEEAAEEVLTAIRTVLGGEMFVSRKVATAMLQNFLSSRPAGSSAGVESLSDRELQVLRLLGAGFSSRHAAEHLHLSLKTVNSHRESIKQKLHLRDSAALVHHATHWVQKEPHLPTPPA